MATYNPGAGFGKTNLWNPRRLHPRLKIVRPHEGDDWGAAAGAPIPAAADGKVIHLGWIGGYGNSVAVEHQIRGKTVHTFYALMYRPPPLKVGDEVPVDVHLATAGGASLIIEGGSIVVSCPGTITVHARKKSFLGPTELKTQLPTWNKGEAKSRRLSDFSE